MMNWYYRCSRDCSKFFWRNFYRDKGNCAILHFSSNNLFLWIKNTMNPYLGIFKINGISFPTKTSIIPIEDIVVWRLHSPIQFNKILVILQCIFLQIQNSEFWAYFVNSVWFGRSFSWISNDAFLFLLSI